MYQEKLTIQQNKEDKKYINLKRYTLKGLKTCMYRQTIRLELFLILAR